MPQAGLTTTTQLLEALGDPGNEAIWREFDARYRGIIEGFARRLGLRAEDAADVAQQTLAEFVRDYRAGKYRRESGRLRSWIMGIARHRVMDVKRRQARRREARGDSAFDEHTDAARVTAIWNEENERAILARAIRELRDQTKTEPKTIRVFEMVAVDGLAPALVAEQTGITLDEVYRVKSRVTRQLRALVERITQAWEEP